MKISVVGSTNMDMNIISERIPLKGETVKGSSINFKPGGKGANQAVAMAKLGAKVTFYGCVGSDENGTRIIDNFNKEGINTKNIKTIKNVETGIAIITIGENDNTIVVVPGANGYVTKEYVNSIKESLLESELVVLQNEIPLETTEYLIDMCYENDIKVILNPAPAFKVKKDLIEKITYLTPNEHEAELIFGKDKTVDEMLKEYPKKLIITLGSKGVAFAETEDIVKILPARKTKVVDTTGAGDTLNGAFAVKVLETNNVENALKFANIAASLSIEKLGAQAGMPTLEKVMEVYKEKK